MSEELFKDRLYLDEVKFQIEKDLGIAGFEFQQASYLNLEELLPELIEAVTRIRTQSPEKWMKIIEYRFWIIEFYTTTKWEIISTKIHNT
jgi:hypothetical protein